MPDDDDELLAVGRSVRPGSGWHFSRYGRRHMLAAIPRIGDWRLHVRAEAPKLRHSGVAFGVWLAPDEDGTNWELVLSAGVVTVTFFAAHFWPGEAPDA